MPKNARCRDRTTCHSVVFGGGGEIAKGSRRSFQHFNKWILKLVKTERIWWRLKKKRSPRVSPFHYHSDSMRPHSFHFHSLHHFLCRKLTVAKLQKSDSCADQYNYSQRDNDDHSASRIDHNPDLGRKSSVAIRRESGLENPLRSAQCELLGGRMILQVRHHL